MDCFDKEKNVILWVNKRINYTKKIITTFEWKNQLHPLFSSDLSPKALDFHFFGSIDHFISSRILKKKQFEISL